MTFLSVVEQWPNSSIYTDDKEDTIVFIIIDSKHTLNQFSKDTAQHTKMPATRLRSAIAKGQNCADIAILTNQLTPAPVIAPSAAIDGLYNWLKTQAEAGALLDSTGEVSASDVLSALPPKAHVFRQKHSDEDAPNDALKACEQKINMWKSQVSSNILDAQQVDDMSDVPFDAHESTAEALGEDARALTNHPLLKEALVALEQQGMADVAEIMGSIVRNGLEYDVLKSR
ncbi:MAG: hypothetical protein VYD08_06265 [Pseudomonadota bacterium]|nr:hypothetical protein [Pseudomonadota bacterium]